MIYLAGNKIKSTFDENFNDEDMNRIQNFNNEPSAISGKQTVFRGVEARKRSIHRVFTPLVENSNH